MFSLAALAISWVNWQFVALLYLYMQAARTRQDGTMEEIEANTQQLLHALFPG
jgi:hypothetical protein